MSIELGYFVQCDNCGTPGPVVAHHFGPGEAQAAAEMEDWQVPLSDEGEGPNVTLCPKCLAKIAKLVQTRDRVRKRK